jgi:hypothetical protein
MNGLMEGESPTDRGERGAPVEGRRRGASAAWIGAGATVVAAVIGPVVAALLR